MSIVITGAGIISAVGDSLNAFCEHMTCQTKLSDGPLSVADFDVKKYVNRKSFRGLDNITKMALAASVLALSDSGFEINEENKAHCGIVLGTAYGSIQSITGFNICARTKGFNALMPADFVNTVMNAPAGQIGIILGTTGINVTVSSGDSSSMDSAIYCVDTMEESDISMMLCGGVEEYCNIYERYFEAKGFIDSKPNGEGFSLGDGAVLFVLEQKKAALDRGAKIYAEILGRSRVFDPGISAEGVIKLIKKATEDASIDISDIDAVVTSTGKNRFSREEEEAVSVLFPDKPTFNIKEIIGETYSVSGAFQLLTGMQIIRNCGIPSKEKFSVPPTVLVNQISIDGNHTCMILK